MAEGWHEEGSEGSWCTRWSFSRPPHCYGAYTVKGPPSPWACSSPSSFASSIFSCASPCEWAQSQCGCALGWECSCCMGWSQAIGRLALKRKCHAWHVFGMIQSLICQLDFFHSIHCSWAELFSHAVAFHSFSCCVSGVRRFESLVWQSMSRSDSVFWWRLSLVQRAHGMSHTHCDSIGFIFNDHKLSSVFLNAVMCQLLSAANSHRLLRCKWNITKALSSARLQLKLQHMQPCQCELMKAHIISATECTTPNAFSSTAHWHDKSSCPNKKKRQAQHACTKCHHLKSTWLHSD